MKKYLLILVIFALISHMNLYSQVSYSQNWNAAANTASWSTNWSSTTTTPCEGSRSVRRNIYTVGTQGAFLSPLLGTSNGGIISMSFVYKIINWTGGGATPATFGSIEVQYGGSSTGPWTTAYTINSSNHNPSTSCALINVSFTPAAGNLFVRFNCIYGEGDYYTYFDDVIISQGAPPSCIVPTALAVSNITTTSATIGWTAPSPAPANGYQWEVRTSGAGGSGAEGLAASGSTAAGVVTANVSGLASGTNYNLYVRSNCGGGDFSGWAGPQTFATPCEPVVLVSEGFENATFPPTCWSLTLAGTSSWLRTTLASGFGSGTASIIANFYSISSAAPFEIITPPFNIANARLSFDHAYATYVDEVDKLKIFYSTNGGSTYTELVELNGGLTGSLNTAGASSSGFIPTAGQWASKFYDLPAGANMDKFQAISAWGNNLFIDNIKISQPLPIDLKLLSISQASGINPTAPLMNSLLTGKSALQVPQFLALDPNESGTATSASGQTELFQNDNTRSPQQLNEINLDFIVDNIGLNPSAYTLNWTVEGVAQSPFVGSVVSPDAQAIGQLSYTPTARGTFMASGTLSVPGDGDVTNNSNQTRVRVYPNQFARTTYDNGTNVPTTFFGYNSLTTATIAAVRFTTPNNFTKLAGVDFFARTEDATTGTFTVEVRAAGTTTTAPGPVFYTKTYTNATFFSANGDLLHFAFDDDFPSLGPNSDYWITITTPLGILYPAGAQAVTTGRSFVSNTGTTWSALISNSINYAWMMRSVHVEGTPHPPCPVPAQPTTLALTPQTTSIGGTFVSAVGTTGHIVVRTSIPALSEAPQNGSVYNTTTNSTIGNGTVVFVSTVTTTFSNTGLT
ncbi:MAG: choice-of-anchor J domain-containing protein, partial [Bacteroidales bacterium]|nr:choice-of-anchor J domain-containing protein [Bacteroidales bacterium]